MIYLLLFVEFFNVALFTFGGGYASLPLIYEAVVESHGWITAQEFADIIAIEGMAPGPFAINISTFVGTLIAGLPGAIVATIAICTPAMFICTVLAGFYFKYKDGDLMKSIFSSLRPTAIGLIASAAIGIFLMGIFNNGNGSLVMENFNIWSVFIFLASLYLLRNSKLNELWLIVFGFTLGVVLYAFI